MHELPRSQSVGESGEPTSFWFGPFQLDTRGRRLTRDGDVLPVSSKAFDILSALVLRAGRTVTKDQLMELVWPGVFVDEVNLAQHVSLLRKLLGDSTKSPSFIATIPRQGYQFIAEVTTSPPVEDIAAGPVPARTGRAWYTAALVGLAVLLLSAVTWLARDDIQASPSVGSDNQEAVGAYLGGRYLIAQGSKVTLPMARDEFERAVRADPAFARAWAELAHTYVAMFLSSHISYSEAIERAQGAASTALSLDPDLSEAHLALGAVYLQLGGGLEKAEPELRRAIALDEANALAYDLLARGLRRDGRFPEAIDAARRALSVEPTSPRYHLVLARTLFLAGKNLDEARALCERALGFDRASTNALELLADIEESDGQLEAAVASWALFERHLGAFDLAMQLEADLAAVGHEEALQRYRQAKLHRLDPADPATGFDRGRLLGRLGRLDEAFDAFRGASAGRYTIGVFGLRMHPAYRALTADPRFAELEALSLPGYQAAPR